MQVENRVGYWIGLPLANGKEGEDAHVTIVLRQDCQPYEFQQLVDVMNAELKPLLPIVAVIRPEIIMRDYQFDVPTHDVIFPDVDVDKILKRIYSTW
jgi:hypothetical protein